MIWVNRSKETLDAGQKKPTAEVKSLLEAAKLLGAARPGAVGLHADVVVAISRATDHLHAGPLGNEAFCIDSPVFPDELEILPAIADRPASRCWARWPRTPTGTACWGASRSRRRRWAARESTAARLIYNPGEAQRELRAFDEELYVERPGPFSLPGAQSLPMPGHCGIGEPELELHPADGHTEDGMAVWVPWARVLVAGDYLSPVEIPMLRRAGWRAGSWRRRPAGAARRAGRPRRPRPRRPAGGAGAAAILREDRAYVEGLIEHGAEAKLPLARRGAAQKKIHAENATRVTA